MVLCLLFSKPASIIVIIKIVMHVSCIIFDMI